ncbi:MAG: hypothetical protein M3N31_02840 [Actinomycetota bacterium]|nr:hypothetical protein [Actinomycetota bacterium]
MALGCLQGPLEVALGHGQVTEAGAAAQHLEALARHLGQPGPLRPGHGRLG